MWQRVKGRLIQAWRNAGLGGFSEGEQFLLMDLGESWQIAKKHNGVKTPDKAGT
jgi:hypothetical protein